MGMLHLDESAWISAALVSIVGARPPIEELAALVAMLVTLVGVIGSAYSRLVRLEGMAAANARQIAIMEQETQQVTERLAERLSALERDRTTIERMHSIETSLTSINVRLGAIEYAIRDKDRN